MAGLWLVKAGVAVGLVYGAYAWVHGRGVAHEAARQQALMDEVNGRITMLNAELDEAHATLERLRARQASEALAGVPNLPACAKSCSLPPDRRDALNAVR